MHLPWPPPQVAALKTLANKQAAALSDLGESMNQQLAAISLATQNNLISLYQVWGSMLLLWLAGWLPGVPPTNLSLISSPPSAAH